MRGHARFNTPYTARDESHVLNLSQEFRHRLQLRRQRRARNGIPAQNDLVRSVHQASTNRRQNRFARTGIIIFKLNKLN